MKKFTKLLALGLAAALTFGMTVSAAESPDTDSSNNEGRYLLDQVGAIEIAEAEGDVNLYANVVSGNDLEKAKAEVDSDDNIIAALDIEGTFDGDSITLTFEIDGVSADKEYVALHGLANGSWETLPATVVEDGVLKVTFTGFSPVVFVELAADVDDEDDDDDDDDDDNDTKEVSGVVASPKTGAGLPVAGVMAVVCLAGAAVSTKKARN